MFSASWCEITTRCPTLLLVTHARMHQSFEPTTSCSFGDYSQPCERVSVAEEMFYFSARGEVGDRFLIILMQRSCNRTEKG